MSTALLEVLQIHKAYLEYNVLIFSAVETNLCFAYKINLKAMSFMSYYTASQYCSDNHLNMQFPIEACGWMKCWIAFATFHLQFLQIFLSKWWHLLKLRLRERVKLIHIKEWHYWLCSFRSNSDRFYLHGFVNNCDFCLCLRIKQFIALWVENHWKWTTWFQSSSHLLTILMTKNRLLQNR